jgi:hypothetical protein
MVGALGVVEHQPVGQFLVEQIEVGKEQVAPLTEAVVEAIESAQGEVVVQNGAAEGNAQGLTTQVPTLEAFLVSGPTRKLRLGNRTIDLRHGSRWQLALGRRPLVMAADRHFWEKAAAAHVLCDQKRLRGERYSRHWYDLVALAQDFAAMREDGLLALDQPEFDAILETCADIQDEVNRLG